MPITAIAFTVAALSIAGFPGFNGFVSKGIVISASHYTFEKGPLAVAGFNTLEWMLLIGGVGTFMSFIKFGYYAFFHGSYDGEVKPAGYGTTAAMGVVAVLCVVYGLFDSTLFAILPFDVTSKAVVEKAYTTYTVDHIVEGVALAILGLVGFYATKKPLSKLGRVPDVDRLYNPAVFYGSRGLVVGVTELYAAADRLAVATASATVQAVSDPRQTLSAVRNGDTERSLRAGIGTSVLVLAAVVAITLVALL
jgi:multicomponent Na+:H+ antiporter subunit D